MIQLMPLPSLSSLASLKSRMVLPFWCRLTRYPGKKAVKWVYLCLSTDALPAANSVKALRGAGIVTAGNIKPLFCVFSS